MILENALTPRMPANQTLAECDLMLFKIAACFFVALSASLFLLGERASAAIVEVGDLNIIDDPGNPSDGLRFLDMTFSNGKTLADALASAITSYANVRVATPSEFDDLFAAAGISYNGSETASDAFTAGSDTTISDGTNYNGLLKSTLGNTFSAFGLTRTMIWTMPDEDAGETTTRDILILEAFRSGRPPIGPFTGEKAYIIQSDSPPLSSSVGWLLVSDATIVPEPSSALLMCLGTAGWLGCRRRH